MKSITIHGVDEQLAKLIKLKARTEGLSVNKTIKKVLEEALGVTPRSKSAHRGDFKEFCGVWSNGELADFIDRTEDFTTVDVGDWQ